MPVVKLVRKGAGWSARLLWEQGVVLEGTGKTVQAALRRLAEEVSEESGLEREGEAA